MQVRPITEGKSKIHAALVSARLYLIFFFFERTVILQASRSDDFEIGGTQSAFPRSS